MSKGDSPRPHDPARYRSEWERIFKQDPCDLTGLRAVFGVVLGPNGYSVWDLRSPQDKAMDEHARLWPGDPARGETGEET